MRLIVGLALIAAGTLAACGVVKDDTRSHGVEPGAGGSSASELDGGRGGSVVAPAVPVPDARPMAAPPADPGPTPPTYCVPTCIWEAIRGCTPPAAEICEISDEDFSRSILCDPSSRWARRIVRGGSTGTQVIISRDGVDCVSESHGGKNPIPAYFYYNGSGSVGGYITYDGSEARCSDSLAAVIALEPGRPECARWTGPGGQLFPELSCNVTVPGDCDMGP